MLQTHKIRSAGRFYTEICGDKNTKVAEFTGLCLGRGGVDESSVRYAVAVKGEVGAVDTDRRNVNHL